MPRENKLTLIGLLMAAGKKYPDQSVDDYWRPHPKCANNNKVKIRNVRGDTLAKFVAIEISETYEAGMSNDKKIDRAIECIEKAIGDLWKVTAGLEELRRKDVQEEAVGKKQKA